LYRRSHTCCPFFASGNFDVINDDADVEDFRMRIIDYESGDTLFQPPPDAREGTFKLENVKPSHRYELCFQNTSGEDDDDFAFNVGFSVRVTNPPRTLDAEEIGPDAQRALKLVQSSSAILEDWGSLMDHFDFLRNREGIHQEMNDAILNRIQRWTIIEALLVMGMATGQVLYWKRFFETRRYL
jgi:hypothetical protein